MSTRFYVSQWGKSHPIPAQGGVKLYQVSSDVLEAVVKFSNTPGGAHYHRFSGKDAAHFIEWARREGYELPAPV